MHFNPDPIKKVQEVIFTRIISKEYHPSLIVKLNSVLDANSQKQLGIIFDSRLSFEEHLNMILNKLIERYVFSVNFITCY